MSIIEGIKNIGRAIASGYRRLGEVDCPDEIDILDQKTENGYIYKESLAQADEKYANLIKSSASSKNGGKVNSSNVVETVVIDPRVIKVATKSEGTRVTTEKDEREI